MSYNQNKRFRGSSPGSPGNMNQNNSLIKMEYDNGLHHKQPAPRANNILIYTIINQKYVISIDAIHKISSRFGLVLRVVMIRKRGTQALVEFEDVATASRAMDGLQNQDIYSGCCTLKIDYSKTTKLNVRRNDQNTWDFTVQKDYVEPSGDRQPLIHQSPYNGNQGYQGGGGNQGGGMNNYQIGHYNSNNNMGGRGDMGRSSHMSGGGGNNQDNNRTSVCIIYGLNDDRINCQYLFNVFCLYGNISKIKFMKSKPGCAMIEYSSTDAVTKTTQVQQLELFNSQLTVRPSRSQFIGEPKGDSFRLPDDSIGYEDFSQSKFNRFLTAEKAMKNRTQQPRSTLHFYNAPLDISEDKVRQTFEDAMAGEACKIRSIVIFNKKGERSKSSSGLIEFDSIGQACTALALVNHISIETSESSYPFNIKLCFATQDLV